MLIFATGIFIVALMFYGFVSGIELKTVTISNLEVDAKVIEEQINNDSLCSFKSIAIPESFNFGLGGSSRLFYDLVFSKEDVGGNTQLILSIKEHNKDEIIVARSVIAKGGVVLVDPGFIASDDPIAPFYDEDEIVLYPRAAITNNKAPANSFVALKEVILGNQTIYIIPCSTYIESDPNIPNNCIVNILKVGCYKLKLDEGSPSDTDVVSDCFDVAREVLEGQGLVSGLTWKQCVDMGYYKTS